MADTEQERMEKRKKEQLDRIKAIYKTWTDNRVFNPKFTVFNLKEPHQYADWKFRILVDFNRYELTYLLTNDLDVSVMDSEEFKRLNQSAVDNLGINLDPDLRRCFIPDSTRDKAKDVWDRVIAKFEGSGAVQTIRLFTRVQQLLTEPSNDLVSTIATIREVKGRFDEITPNDKDALWKAILNRAIPEEREALRSILSTLPADKQLEDHFDLVLQSGQMDNLNGEGQSGKLVNKLSTKRNDRQHRNDRSDKQKVRCFFCKQAGHVKKECDGYKKWLTKQASAGQPKAPTRDQHFSNKQNTLGSLTSGHSALVQTHDEEVYELSPTVYQSRLINKLTVRKTTDDQTRRQPNDCRPANQASSAIEQYRLPRSRVNAVTSTRMKIYSDGGANHHYLNSAKGVVAFRKINDVIYTASEERLQIEGTGEAVIQSSVGQRVRLERVIVCTQLSASYISELMLERVGYQIRSENGRRRFFLNGVLMMVAEADENDLFEIMGRIEYIIKCNALLQSDVDRILQLHDALAHVNIDDLRRLQDRLGICIPGDRKIECLICAKAKATRLPFSKTHRLSRRPLDLIHTDLSGIIRIANRQRYKYFLLLIDDYSRKTFVYLLRSKEEVSEKFREFKAMIELKVERKIKQLKSDGGTEFNNQRMSEIASESGMVQLFSAPRCPPQNGGPERLNRTIETMARCMLLDSVLGTSFWPFAVLYAAFIKDRLPHKAIGGQIPIELFYKIKVNYDEIKKFGCRLIYLVDDEPITKFDPRGKDGLFLGYPENYRAVYIYSLESKKIIIRRHVYFLTHPENQIKGPVDLNESGSKSDSEPLFDYDEAEERSFHYNGQPDDLVDAAVQSHQANTVEHEATSNVTNDPEAPSTSSESPTAEHEASSNVIGELEAFGNSSEATLTNSAQSSADQSQQVAIPDQTEEQQQNTNQLESNQSRPERGSTIQLTADQRVRLETEFPDIDLQFTRPVRLTGGKGAGVYRVNAIRVPKTYNQIKSTRQDEHHWRAAVQAELDAMEQNGVWVEVDRPVNRQVLPLTWIFKVKFTPDGEVDKYKGRLCALGNLLRQRSNQNYYAPVLNETVLRALLAFGTKRKMHQHHVDVVTAYLNSELTDEEIYVEYPAGMIAKKGKCLRLKKSIYGLPSSALNWYNTISQILISLGFTKLRSDRCTFVNKYASGRLGIIGLYVDDLLLMGDDEWWLQQIKEKISQRVNISDKGTISYFLSLEIVYRREQGILKISQRDYIAQTVESFGMSTCRSKRTPSPSGAELFEAIGEPLQDSSEYLSLVGRLIYISTHSRPDLKFVVSRLCQHGANPTAHYMNVAKHVLRYLQTTIDYGLYYTADGPNVVEVNCDADHANDKLTSRSITGVTVQLFGNLVAWESRKQYLVAKATCQSEVYAIESGIDNLKFLRDFLSELIDTTIIRFELFNDNTSAIATCLHGGDHAKNKSYRVAIHKVMEILAEKWATLSHKTSTDMKADFLTKPLTADSLARLLSLIGVF